MALQQTISDILNTPEDVDCLRRLGGLERWFYYMDRHRSSHFSLAAEVVGAVQPAEWEGALYVLQQRHPLLNVSILDNEEPEFVFHPAAAPKPLRIVKRKSPADWKREIEKEAVTAFDTTNAPLMRMVLLQGPTCSDIILTIHHSIADGMALLFLLRDLLRIVSGEALPSLAIPLSIEGIRSTLPAIAALGSGTEPPAPVAPRQIKYRGSNGNPPTIETYRLTSEDTSRIVLTAKAKGVTVHSALTAGLVLAGQQSHGAWRQFPVRVFTPINIRESHEAGDSVAVVLGAGLVHVEPGPLDDLWAIATRAKHDLAFFRELEHEFMISGLLGQVSSDSSKAVQITADALGYDLILTSPGIVDLDLNSDKISVRSVWGPSVVMGFAEEQSVSALTYQGRLYLTHTSFAPIPALLFDAVQLLLNAT